ncbi:MAG: hypothetical protein QXM27_02220 [Candidatus Pacearchaeota archaeon]
MKKYVNKVLLALAILIFISLIIFIIFKLSSQKTGTKQETLLYTVEYSIYVDGQVYDNGIKSFLDGEATSSFGFKKNIDDLFIDVSNGKEFNISLKASEAYGEYDESLREIVEATIKQKRILEIPFRDNMTRDEFIENFNSEPLVNHSYETILFPIKVISVKEGIVEYVFDVKIGDKTNKNELGFWFDVADIDEEKNILKLRMNNENKQIPEPNGYGLLNISIDEDYIYFTLIPKLNEEIEWNNKFGRVVSFNDSFIVLDNNHPLAGKDIVLYIKILNISKQGFVFDVFIMSYCPFGIQFVKALLPVWREFKDIADINVRFVSYTMHGQKEEEENKRMICIREEEKNKFIDYLDCFTLSADAETCMRKANINIKKINECMEKRAKKYLDYDAELNKKYKVLGSPTVVINGKIVEVSRSPAAIARVICSYFKEKPKECSLEFSEQIASPGFGSGIGNNVGGSCR